MKIAFPLAFLSLCVACGPAVAAEAKKPNIIFVLADDLGIDGVSCYGAERPQNAAPQRPGEIRHPFHDLLRRARCAGLRAARCRPGATPSAPVG